jgi:hypothetical protein
MVDFYAVSFELICCQFQFQHFYLNVPVKTNNFAQISNFSLFVSSVPAHQSLMHYGLSTRQKLKCARPSNLKCLLVFA